MVKTLMKAFLHDVSGVKSASDLAKVTKDASQMVANLVKTIGQQPHAGSSDNAAIDMRNRSYNQLTANLDEIAVAAAGVLVYVLEDLLSNDVVLAE